MKTETKQRYFNSVVNCHWGYQHYILSGGNFEIQRYLQTFLDACEKYEGKAVYRIQHKHFLAKIYAVINP